MCSFFLLAPDGISGGWWDWWYLLANGERGWAMGPNNEHPGDRNRVTGKWQWAIAIANLVFNCNWVLVLLGRDQRPETPPVPCNMAGLGNNPVQVFATKLRLHWEFLRLWTGFELPSSWVDLPCYGFSLNRNILDFMRWPQIGLGAQDLNDIQRPK
jgi:hypothetical protein